VKNLLFHSTILLTLLFISACKKDKVCSNLPEGLYEGWFANEGASSTYTLLYVSIIDENTMVINTTGDSSFGPFVKRDGCFIDGVIQGKNCLGEIHQENGKYSISGTYSYFTYSGGLGNQNPQSTEIKGSFEVKSN
jgi:hypothetical protein